MRRTSLTATAALSLALIAPALPAGAAGTLDTAAAVSPPAQVAGQAQDTAVAAQSEHRRHWRGFRIGGRIEDKDSSPRRIVVDQRRGPDRVIRVNSYTRIYRDGDRVGFRALREGDRVFVKGIRKDGRRYAVKIWADS